jgi:serine protease
MRINISKYLLLIPILVLAMIINISAQDFKKTAAKKSSVNENANVIPGSIIVKLKPEFRHLTNNLNALKKIPGLEEVFRKYNVQKFAKMFPHRTGPVQPKNPHLHHKHKIPDLSLMHVLHFNPNIPVYELIEKLRASGFVEYAEPRYLVEMQYLPNDPISQSSAQGELLLQRINAYNAWSVEKGDPNVVIGVLDTGTELTHPDLINSVKYNTADPINGVDDDGDGYKDNYQGWDMGSGANLGLGDNDPTWEVIDHGVRVQGACSASGDNSIGTTGTGFNCKCLPVKISNTSGGIVAGYESIEYAATHGVKVINLSWGGFSPYSQADQDLINDAALGYDVLIVAAAGNSEREGDIYPGSYDNVFSVTGLDTITSPMYDTIYERRKTFPTFPGVGMTYSFKVDISSLEGGMSTDIGGTWNPFGGSSFASPTTAGAGALVRSKYPQLSGVQAGELLRVTGEILDTFDITRPESRYKIGRKLNMYKALTSPTIPSVRMTDFAVTGKHQNKYFSGDTLTITQDFFNYLSKANNLSIKMICSNGYASVLDNSSNLGFIDSLTAKNNLGDPFKIIINNNAGSNQVVDLVMIMTDPSANYYDFQGFQIIVNPEWLDLDTNKIKTSITSKGRIGFNDAFAAQQGIGVKYGINNPSATSLLFEGGLMIGTSTSKVSDCIRTSYPGVNDEFMPVRSVHYVDPSSKDLEAYCVFNDSSTSNPSVLGFQIEQRSYAWKNAPNDKYVIIEYKITNKSAVTYDSIFAAVYTDWDIGDPNYNRGDWDNARNVAYTYSTQGGYKVAGVSLLTNNKPSCYSLEYPPPFGTIDGYTNFSTSRKFNAMAKGLAKKQAGTSGFGTEVSQVTGARILSFAPGDVETVAFAIIVADDVIDLMDVAQNAKNKFVSIKQGPVPTSPNFAICRQDTIDINVAPSNGNNFAFYTSPPPAAPVYTGSNYTMTNISNADTIYVANADSLFNSNVKAVYINKDNMDLEFYPNPANDTITLATGGTLLLVNQSSGASSVSWDLGDGNTATGNSVTHVYNTNGYYNVKLTGISPLNCNDTLARVLYVNAALAIKESLNGTELSFYPNPVNNTLTIEFANNTLPGDLSIELINALGITVYSSQSGTKLTNLDMAGYPAGVYYVKLKSGNNVLNKMIIKN